MSVVPAPARNVRPWGFEIAGLAVVIDGEGPRFYPAGFPPVSPPRLTLHARPASATETLRPVGEPAIEQDSWAAFYADGNVTFVVKSGYVQPPEIARIDVREGESEGTLRFWPMPIRRCSPSQPISCWSSTS